jgi:predicted dehydrogenase
MRKQGLNRRNFLKTMGGAGALAAAPAAAFGAGLEASLAEPGNWVHEVVPAVEQEKPKYSIKFAVCGISHDHIYGMIGAVQRGGGVLTKVYGTEPDKIATFRKRFPDVSWAASEEEILHDSSVQLVMTSTVPALRAKLGIRAMKAGKDFLSDKPGVTSLNDLAEIRRTIEATKKIYAILYSERLEVKAAVKAGELVQAGAIGKVIQTINIAPHQVQQGGKGDAGGAGARPDWFWDVKHYGGILTDIGSHQVDQFLFYTGSTKAEIAESQVANVNHPQHPKFQDFGDMVLRGNKGLGYVRLDWFTPDGLGTWGDGRLFILGTEGYIEARKYINVAVSKQGNNLFLVDGKQSRSIDCSNVDLPFGPQFVADIVNRTHVAQDQVQCLLAAELVIRAQMQAKMVVLEA